MNKFTFLSGLLGAGLGFAYYRFVGCQGGSCPIWASPWMSTLYGALLGALLFSAFGQRFVPASSQYKNLDAQTVETWLQENKDAVILDVRTTGEFQAGHLPDALHINYFDGDFAKKVGNLDKSKSYLVYCQSGRRSVGAAEKMASLGFTNLHNLKGGIGSWKGKIVKK